MFSDPASCGPSSSVQKLSSFANSGNVINNDYNTRLNQQANGNLHNSGFAANHLNTLDHRLENDFNQFAQHPRPHQHLQQQHQHQHQNDFFLGGGQRLAAPGQNQLAFRQASNFNTPRQVTGTSLNNNTATAAHPNNKSNDSNAWISDFSTLHLDNFLSSAAPATVNILSPQLGGRNAGFAESPFASATVMQPHANTNTNAYANGYAAAPRPGLFRYNTATTATTSHMANMSEHQQLHHTETELGLDVEMDLFDQAFNDIEAQMAEASAAATEAATSATASTPESLPGLILSADNNVNTLANFSSTQEYTHQHPENHVLSDIAAKIANTMESKQETLEMESKFKNSSFLKLMNRISSKQVGLAENGRGLINTSTGMDINKQNQQQLLASDPVAIETQDGNRLPDPLSFLQDGDVLESSDQVRNLLNERISRANGDHILPRDIHDISMDYRHDDDAF